MPLGVFLVYKEDSLGHFLLAYILIILFENPLIFVDYQTGLYE